MPILPPIQIPTNDLYPNRGMGIDIPFNKPGVFTSRRKIYESHIWRRIKGFYF